MIKKSLIGMCLLEAKRCIARSWKKPTVCGVSEWLNWVTSYLALEKISYFTKNRIDRFWSIWKVFHNFLENEGIQSDGGSDDLNWFDCYCGCVLLFFFFYLYMIYPLRIYVYSLLCEGMLKCTYIVLVFWCIMFICMQNSSYNHIIISAVS